MRRGLALIAQVLSSLVWAQTESTGSITGSAVDSNNAPVPGADVTARNQDTLATRTTKTGQGGRFYLPALPIGTYTLRVEKSGFAGVMVSRFLLPLARNLFTKSGFECPR